MILANTKAELGWVGEISTVLFLLFFIGVIIYTFKRSNRKVFEEAAQLPLDDSQPHSDREESK